MNKIICMLLLSLFFAAPTIVHAQDTSKVAKTKMERKKEMREKRKNLTPEQKEKAKEMVQKRKEKMENMTDKQLQFIAWLITTATDKCETIEEVREMNNEIRKHSAGLLKETTKENE